jgi:hypothetical protein
MQASTRTGLNQTKEGKSLSGQCHAMQDGVSSADLQQRQDVLKAAIKLNLDPAFVRGKEAADHPVSILRNPEKGSFLKRNWHVRSPNVPLACCVA